MIQNNSLQISSERITILDALRGFALLGVVLIHMLQHYGIFSFSLEPRESPFPEFDRYVRWLGENVISGKFINIFAFLFGMSFFIQMDRAAKKGIDFRKRFIWRMAVLFVIGMIGNCFYTADILSIYALFGVLLVLLFRVKNWILLVVFSLLLLGAPRIIQTGYDSYAKSKQTETVQPETNAPPAFAPPANPEKPSFLNSAKDNLTRGMQFKINYQFGLLGRGYVTLALFILGLVVGRTRFFEGVHERRRRNVMLFFGFVLAALLVYGLIGLFPPQQIGYFMQNTEITPALLSVMALSDIGAVAFSGALVMGFIILYGIKGVGNVLNVLVPYGRMGLTNYEMQGVLGSLIFSMWAFGSVFGNWSSTELFLLGLAVYATQLVISKYWLKYFLYGPLEWFWRSATYLKRQPFKRK